MALDELDDTLIDLREKVVPRRRSIPELLADHPHIPNPSLVEELGRAIEAGWPPSDADDPDDPRFGTWRAIVDELARLERPRYIGTFGIAVRAAADHAKHLSPSDRRLAARLVVDRTAATAPSMQFFRLGVEAAASIAREVLHPQSVVDTLVLASLRHAQESKRPSTIAFALEITLEVFAAAEGPSISGRNVWPLRAAVAATPKVEKLRKLAEQLHRNDRHVLSSVFPAPPVQRPGRFRR